MRPALAILAAALASLGPATALAHAGEPIMPLGEVRAGMQCQGRSVVQGTAISTFDVEVLDVIAGDAAAQAPRILFRVWGPAVDRTGLGPGFSGSPNTCDGRVIGAISEAIGEYGGKVALATPIELIIGEPVDPPAQVRDDARARRTLRRARTFAAPISVTGLSPAVGALFTRAAARRGRVLVSVPARPRQAAVAGPGQAPLVPGAAMAVGLSAGDVTAGSVGTVAYTDGDRVWSFGHPLDGAGRRSLFLHPAYVYTVINNPVATEGISTYKLAAPGAPLGTLSSDGPNAVVGRTGALPARFPVRVVARDADTDRVRLFRTEVADEQPLGLPVGASPLAFAGPAMVTQAIASVLGGTPARQTGELHVRMKLRGRARPMEFRRRYVVRGAGDQEGLPGVAGPMVQDMGAAVAAIDEYNVDALRLERVDVFVTVRRGLRQAFMLRGKPRSLKRGRTSPVRLRVKEYRGEERTVVVPVRVPADLRPGRRTLTLTGTPTDGGGEDLELDLGELLFGEGDAPAEDVDEQDELGPPNVDALAAVIGGLGGYDGVRAAIGDRPSARVYRDPVARLTGRVRIPVRIRR